MSNTTNRIAGIIAAVTLSSILSAQDIEVAKPKDPKQDTPKLDGFKQKASYIIGQRIGSQMRDGAVDLDVDAFLKGLREGLAGKKMTMDRKTINDVMQQAQTEWQTAATKRKAEEAKKNLADGKAYLEKNMTAEGVVTTESGLQYKILKPGTGEKPKSTSEVTVHYHGTLIDGTVFDSSVERGEPASFPVNGVIKGWTEGLQLMPVGSKWKFFIPSDLAYGKDPRPGGPIGPNAVLVFEVELISFK